MLRLLGELCGGIDAPAIGCGIAHDVDVLCLKSLLAAERFGLDGPVLQVEGQAILSGLCHLPFVVRSGGKHEIMALNTTQADLTATCGRADERHIPTASLQACLQLARH